MTFKSIRHAQQQVWPKVQESLRIHQLQRDATRANPDATPAAKNRANRPWHRVVADETVWALAKSDLLLTEEAQEVIKIARAWAKSWESEPSPPSYAAGDTEEDVDLYRAIQGLAVAFEPDAEEPLTLSAPASTVHINNH